MERHVHHVMVELQGEKKGPSRSLYKKYQDLWSKIEKDVNTLGNIEKYDWNRPEFAFGTLFYNLANETMEFCTTALKANIFDRGDYKYLCQLVAFYLGADLLNSRFLQPGAHHEARFMTDSLYLLAMQMTKNYNKQLSINEIKMI